MPTSESASGELPDPPSNPRSTAEHEFPAATTPPTPFGAAWPWVLCVIGLDHLNTLAYSSDYLHPR